MDLKHIHIGALIRTIAEQKKDTVSLSSHLGLNEKETEDLFSSQSLNTETLIKISSLLEYDFFRPYSQHLILFAPTRNIKQKKQNVPPQKTQIRKNIYTKNIISFILELLENNEKTKEEIIREYRIPKTTLYKWIKKYPYENS